LLNISVGHKRQQFTVFLEAVDTLEYAAILRIQEGSGLAGRGSRLT
jgi:hypothetical protein